MDGNNGKAIASMTIKQSYVDACVCVCAYGDLLKRPLVVLRVLPQSPRPAWQTSRPLKHIRSCCSGDSLSFSRTRSTWIWAVSVYVPPPPPPRPPPALRACQSVEGAHRIFLLRCVSLSYAFPSQPLDSLCLHLSLHKNGQGVFFISHHLPPYVDC